MILQPGDPVNVNVNAGGDLFMMTEARPFIGKPCRFVKVTRAGLYQVALISDPKKTYSVPKCNIDQAVQ